MAARKPYEEPCARHELGCMGVRCRWCGALHWMGEKLSRSSTNNPIFGMCCNSGKVQLPLLREPPVFLKSLLDGGHRLAVEFRENLWKYNRAFAFTSLRVSEDHSINEHRRGPPVFRIHGELHHRSGPLLPAVDRPPTYAQLYFYDSHSALEHRRKLNSGLNHETLRSLQEMLLEHHQYVPIYQHAFEILNQYDPDDDISIRLRVAPGYHHHRRQYNLPTADEVAVILPGADSDDLQIHRRDIILQKRSGALQTISDLHPAYVPLYYVLLFPYGENGWHPDLRLRTSQRDTDARRLTQT